MAGAVDHPVRQGGWKPELVPQSGSYNPHYRYQASLTQPDSQYTSSTACFGARDGFRETYCRSMAAGPSLAT